MSDVRTADSAPPVGSRISFSGWDILRYTLAAVLITAASLKGHQILTDPATRLGMHGPLWTKSLIIFLELCMSLWLVSNAQARLVHASALVLFASFAGFSFHEFVRGSNTCRCFGELAVHPAWTLALDVSLVSALWLWRPPRKGSLTAGIPAAPRNATFQTLAASSVAVLVAVLVSAYGPELVASLNSTERAIVLRPEDWVGRPLPLLSHARFPPDLKLHEGSWRLIIYDRTCDKCSNFLASLDLSGRSNHSMREETAHVALLDVSPASATQSMAVPAGVAGVAVRQRQINEFIPVPTEVGIKDGIVVWVRSR